MSEHVIHFYSMSEVVSAAIKGDVFDFGNHSYVATIKKTEDYENSYTFGLKHRTAITEVGHWANPEPHSSNSITISVDECVAFSETTLLFLKENLSKTDFKNLEIVKRSALKENH